MPKITLTIEIDKKLAGILERDGFHDDPEEWLQKRLNAQKFAASNMNHEIRTPLTVIAAYAGLIAQTGNLDKNQLEAMEGLNKAVDHIEKILSQYFDS